jgi:hypothetical protein
VRSIVAPIAAAATITGGLVLAPPAYSAPNPASRILGVTLPPNSVPTESFWCSKCRWPHEQWTSGRDYSETVATLRGQLPIGGDLQGVPWCAENVDPTPPPDALWDWSSKEHAPRIQVHIGSEGMDEPYRDQIVVQIQKNPDDASGCLAGGQ